MNLLHSGALEHRGGSFRANMKSRVFISYSSRSQAALAARDALRRTLRKAGYTVFVDCWDLRPGERWRRKIVLALAGCTAGVVLLSNDTLEKRPGEHHPWVLYEAGILSFRHELEPDFRLIPVLLEDVRPEDLRKAPFFSPLALEEIQIARAGEQPQELAQKVQRALGPAAGRKGKRTLLQDVTEAFQEELMELSDYKLQKLATKLRSRMLTAWTREQSLSRIALRLARLVLLGGAEGMTTFILVLLDSLSLEMTRKFLLLVRPLWVQAELAGRLRKLDPRPPLCRCVALTCGKLSFEFTTESHVCRAFWPRLTACPAVINVLPGAREKLFSLVSESIITHVLSKTSLETSEQVEAYLKDVRPDLFIRVPMQFWPPLPAELERIHTQYPTALLLLHTGPEEPAELPREVCPFPPVNAAEERDAYNMHTDADRRFKEHASRINA